MWNTVRAIASKAYFHEGQWAEIAENKRFFSSFLRSLKEANEGDYEEALALSREITETEDGPWGSAWATAADPERAATDLSDWENNPEVFIALFYHVFDMDYPWESSEDPFEWCIHYTPGAFELWGDVENDSDIYYTVREIVTEETVKWIPPMGEQGYVPLGTLRGMIKHNNQQAAKIGVSLLYLINRRSL